VEQIYNFSKFTMVDFRCLGKKFVEFLPKIGENSVNYEMSSDFSLTRLYRRLWSAILRNGPIIAIIRLVKLALLKCLPGLY